MKYREWGPPPDLAQLVQAVWCVSGEPGQTIRVLPDACVDLIALDDRGLNILVNGPMSAATITTLTQNQTFGLRLCPGTRIGVKNLVANSDLKNNDFAVPFDEHEGPPEGLCAFARHLQQEGMLARHPVVDRVLGEIEHGDHTLEATYRRFGLEPRAVQRLFDVYVGLSPKQTATILRQSLATRILRQDEHSDLSTLAAELGYADQAHFTRQYRRQVGLPPGAYRNEIQDVDFVLEDGEKSSETGDPSPNR